MATTGNLTCAIAMLRKYLVLAGIEDLDSEDIFDSEDFLVQTSCSEEVYQHMPLRRVGYQITDVGRFYTLP